MYTINNFIITKKVLFTVALDSKSQIPYPRAFVDKNTVDRGKTRNEAHRTDLKNVGLIKQH